MKKWIEASYNGSRKYNSDYAYNDEWVDCDWSWRILSDRIIAEPDFRSNVLRIKTDKKVSKKMLYRVVGDYFERSCSCEFDCCGCYFGGLVELKKPTNRRNNEHIAIISYSPNY